MAKRREPMTSKERILATVRGEPVDHVPLCFEGVGHPYVHFVNRLHPDPFARATYYLDLGVDTAVSIHDLPMNAAAYQTRQWTERRDPEPAEVAITEYITDAGTLRQEVRRTGDYAHPYPPLFSDHHVPPSRSLRYLVRGGEDLDAVERIFQPPTGEPLDAYRREVATARRFCDRHGLLLAGTLWGVGDPLIWMTGIEPLVMMAMEQPDVMARFVDIVARWNQARLEIHLDAGVDLVYRRGWYESTDFWSPSLYRRFFFEPLRREIRTAHQAGRVYTYIMNTGAMPLLEMFGELGFDIYSNIDPMAGRTDLGLIKRTVGGQMTLYGGVNNNHIIERGTGEQVRRAVDDAFDALADGGRFILGPGDSILADSDLCRRNVDVMIEAWKARR